LSLWVKRSPKQLLLLLRANLGISSQAIAGVQVVIPWLEMVFVDICMDEKNIEKL